MAQKEKPQPFLGLPKEYRPRKLLTSSKILQRQSQTTTGKRETTNGRKGVCSKFSIKPGGKGKEGRRLKRIKGVGRHSGNKNPRFPVRNNRGGKGWGDPLTKRTETTDFRETIRNIPTASVCRETSYGKRGRMMTNRTLLDKKKRFHRNQGNVGLSDFRGGGTGGRGRKKHELPKSERATFQR